VHLGISRGVEVRGGHHGPGLIFGRVTECNLRGGGEEERRRNLLENDLIRNMP